MASVHVERLDHLGLIAHVIKDLGLISMIDTRIVPDEQEEITPGEAVAGMILNGTEVPPRKMLIQVGNILFLLEKIFEHFSFCSHVSGNFFLLSLIIRAIIGPCL